jgi:Lar family restriction alleviation protein
MTKLKPCPFKHPQGRRRIGVVVLKALFAVECFSCGAAGPLMKSEHGAIAAWNRRAGEGKK